MAKNEQPTFETAIERLETIVEKMESDSLPLEELLTRYEEGLKLVKFCSEKLDAAEKRIEIITRDSGGKPRLVEFDPAAKPANNPPPEPTESASDDDVRLF